MRSVICLIFWNLSRGIGKRREKIMIGIEDMTSQEIKELASSRGKEIMEKIENSKGTEEGILRDWLHAQQQKNWSLK